MSSISFILIKNWKGKPWKHSAGKTKKQKKAIGAATRLTQAEI
jgi:hypothetical protein